jgi:4-carboxymuconolactone decarboxylase
MVVAAHSLLAQDRMPPIPADKMTDAQKKAVAEVMAGPRGTLVAPFIPAMRSPELMRRIQTIGEYLRFGSPLEGKLREMSILITARQWTQNYEWQVHKPLAVKEGLKPEVIAAIAEGRRPVGMDAGEEVVYDFLSELQTNKSVTDATYARALKLLGEQKIIDVVGIAGYYSTIGMMMNVARTPAQTQELGKFPQ